MTKFLALIIDYIKIQDISLLLYFDENILKQYQLKLVSFICNNCLCNVNGLITTCVINTGNVWFSTGHWKKIVMKIC